MTNISSRTKGQLNRIKHAKFVEVCTWCMELAPEQVSFEVLQEINAFKYVTRVQNWFHINTISFKIHTCHILISL
jgi:hypothetical protein